MFYYFLCYCTYPPPSSLPPEFNLRMFFFGNVTNCHKITCTVSPIAVRLTTVPGFLLVACAYWAMSPDPNDKGSIYEKRQLRSIPAPLGM
ncbi:hypothetical protein BDN72DRAFT_586039 [Pluteus cervinus]|uniref:Uncharacterized protein n=1 Tax=Pluteus cervinus TaxID=181527 RepID=A0ACD3AVC1_9AGAR|nr:hypothetical protein BDN72DRAFT_586039 [Pluteus cervinus]